MSPILEITRVPRIAGLSNNGVQLTRAARCAPSASRSWGQSLRAALAADAECCAGRRGGAC